jgi:hypothetical protein
MFIVKQQNSIYMMGVCVCCSHGWMIMDQMMLNSQVVYCLHLNLYYRLVIVTAPAASHNIIISIIFFVGRNYFFIVGFLQSDITSNFCVARLFVIFGL